MTGEEFPPLTSGEIHRDYYLSWVQALAILNGDPPPDPKKFGSPRKEDQMFEAAKHQFCSDLAQLCHELHQANVKKGFYADSEGHFDPEVSGLPAPIPDNVWLQASMARVHTEISEAVEQLRKPTPDQHLPQYSGLAVELADAVIRILDTAAYLGIPLGEVIFAKAAYNESRPFKHGKNS